MKRYIKLSLFIFAILILMVSLTACNSQSSLLTALDTERSPALTDCEVLSVAQYVQTNTNRFGGVMSENLCYAFTYKTPSGELEDVTGFCDLKGGYTKVKIDDKDHYVYEGSGCQKRTLYLTEETLKSLKKG